MDGSSILVVPKSWRTRGVDVLTMPNSVFPSDLLCQRLFGLRNLTKKNVGTVLAEMSALVARLTA